MHFLLSYAHVLQIQYQTVLSVPNLICVQEMTVRSSVRPSSHFLLSDFSCTIYNDQLVTFQSHPDKKDEPKVVLIEPVFYLINVVPNDTLSSVQRVFSLSPLPHYYFNSQTHETSYAASVLSNTYVLANFHHSGESNPSNYKYKVSNKYH